MPAAAPSPALFFGVSKEGIGHNFHFQFFQTTRLVRTAKKEGLKKVRPHSRAHRLPAAPNDATLRGKF
jgi:hypothetical protein